MPLDLLTHVLRLAQSAVHRVRVRSALNPMIWLSAISTPTCLLFALKFVSQPAIQLLIVAVGLLPIVVTCFESIGFAIFKADKLQSEDYQLRHERLQIQEKSRRVILDRNTPALPNPEITPLEESVGD